MKKVIVTAMAVSLSLALTSEVQAWISHLDGSSQPGSPGQPYSNEGCATVEDIDGGNN